LEAAVIQRALMTYINIASVQRFGQSLSLFTIQVISLSQEKDTWQY